MTQKETGDQKAVGPKNDSGAPVESAVDLRDHELYINRELSLLAFQRRVLEEAEDETNPLLERVNFLSIVGSNLDEFFMVRVAGLLAQVDAGTVEVGPDRMNPRAQLISIRRSVKRLLFEAHNCADELLQGLRKEKILIHTYEELNEAQKRRVAEYFARTVFPVLTPLASDPGRPFPHISNLSLNLAVLIRDRNGEEHFARVKVPDSLPQLVPLSPVPQKSAKRLQPRRTEMVWIEDIIAAHLPALFPGMEILESHPFHVTRDADIAIKELEAEDLLETIEEGVRQRKFGSVIRLIVTQEMPAPILKILMDNLDVGRSDVYRARRPLALKRLASLHGLDRPDLKYPPFVPATPPALMAAKDEDIFSLIRRGNILLHHPFESFQPVVEFLRQAARDPSVLAIKICLYRVGRNSPIVEALLEALEEDKQVAALVELKARFDEESNIEWARALERSGVHVVYGLIGLKIHSKVALVVRREEDRIARYLHFSTGNYNAVTAHLYTDIGLFTADDEIADDVSNLFNYLTGYSHKTDYRHLLVAPVNLRSGMAALIERELKHAKAGRKARLIFKMNALVDPPMIRALYRASQAGVRVQLLVRGICCLRPGLAGISENIEVISVVGRFLEHSRVYYFFNGGKEQVYIGSADLMPRNIDHRVEVLVPIRDAGMAQRIRDDLLAVYLSDGVKARMMLPNGTYTRKRNPRSRKPVNSQEVLLRTESRSPKNRTKRNSVI
ncbi:MAG: polyphosphate kinase 1 [Terriglobia bacterium]|nr:MAG: polyphosphate kinase 1 [Terriglobia bacterium]